MRITLTFFLFLFLRLPIQAQEVNWISFPQLSDSLKINPKPVFIFFYTDWCSYCRKMENEVFSNAEIIKELNNKFYPVRFNAESKDEFLFEGQLLKNSNPKSRNSIHEIAQLLAARKQGYSFPTTIILNKNFEVTHRNFSYLSSKKLLSLFKN
ncbi:thioredoxin family protein [Sphingobacterium sp. SRCM116780]|uniref:thioredoxin family protein n=1 Tax=Sphingobacterium sp. SRCM116780 TaxID=2907623 RepID=UPI001F3AED0A|nr:thioredoxin family protein [Sphingobacterium sp. SRCM116780]UIR56237.1 thioredoxin family protein [Sphingobacterium sp. SRCM116780]